MAKRKNKPTTKKKTKTNLFRSVLSKLSIPHLSFSVKKEKNRQLRKEKQAIIDFYGLENVTSKSTISDIETELKKVQRRQSRERTRAKKFDFLSQLPNIKTDLLTPSLLDSIPVKELSNVSRETIPKIFQDIVPKQLKEKTAREWFYIGYYDTWNQFGELLEFFDFYKEFSDEEIKARFWDRVSDVDGEMGSPRGKPGYAIATSFSEEITMGYIIRNYEKHKFQTVVNSRIWTARGFAQIVLCVIENVPNSSAKEVYVKGLSYLRKNLPDFYKWLKE